MVRVGAYFGLSIRELLITTEVFECSVQHFTKSNNYKPLQILKAQIEGEEDQQH